MKRIFLIVLAVIFSPSFTLFSFADDITTPVFGSFDDGSANPFELGADGPGSDFKSQSIVDNPFKTGNQTDKCIRVDVPGGAGWWEKTYFKIQTGTAIVPASIDHKYLHFNVLYTAAGNGVEIGVFNTSGELIYQSDINYDVAENRWREVVFDLSTAGDKAGIVGNNIGGIWMRPFGTPGNPCYFDQFTLSDNLNPTIITSPVFGSFDNGNAFPFILGADSDFSNFKDQTITDNPAKTVNTTDKCIKLNVPGGAGWWEKTYFKVQEGTAIVPASDHHKYLRFELMYSVGGNGVEIGVLNTAGVLIYQKDINYTVTNNEWQEVIFDLSDAGDKAGIVGNNIGGIWMRPFGTPGNPCYFDQFTLSDNKNLTPPAGEITAGMISNFEADDAWKANVSKTQVQTNGAVVEVTDNLVKSGINKTDRVLMYQRPSGGEWWNALQIALNGYVNIADNNHYLHIMIYNPGLGEGSGFTVILNDTEGHEKSQDIYPTSTTEWMDYVLDMSGSSLINLNTINLRAGDGTYYIDEIVVNNSSSPRTTDTGTSNIDMNKLKFYLSNKTQFITCDGLESVSVYSIAGKLIAKKNGIRANQTQFELSKGTYIVKALLNTGESLSRVVIVR